MSISTPDSNQGKDEQRENSRENAAPPRPSARRQRRGSKPEQTPVDPPSGDEVKAAQDTADAAQSPADAKDKPVDKAEPEAETTGEKIPAFGVVQVHDALQRCAEWMSVVRNENEAGALSAVFGIGVRLVVDRVPDL